MKRLAVLGSTGSIGTATLDVVSRFPDRFRAVALAAGRNLELLAAQARAHRPELVAVADPADARRLAAELPGIAVLAGEEGRVAVATHPGAEAVVGALVGAVGLVPTWRAILAGRQPAPKVCAAAAMDVHEIGALGGDQAAQAEDKADVDVALHRHLEHAGMGSRGACDVGAGRAGEQVLHAAPRQALDNVEHLLGAAVEVAAGFDVQHLHDACSTLSAVRASSMTRSAVMSRRQVKAPSQVGRRRQGEQGSPSQITRPLLRPASR